MNDYFKYNNKIMETIEQKKIANEEFEKNNKPTKKNKQSTKIKNNETLLHDEKINTDLEIINTENDETENDETEESEIEDLNDEEPTNKKQKKIKETKMKEKKIKEPKIKEPKIKEQKIKEPKIKEKKVKEPKIKEIKIKEKKVKKNKNNDENEEEIKTKIPEKELIINSVKKITYESYKNDNNKLIDEKLITYLEQISNDKELPHVIFYGGGGTGKKTITNMFLSMIYGDSIYNLKKRIYQVPGSGGKVKDIEVLESDYHIIIKPNNNNFDRYMVPKIVKDYTYLTPISIYEEKKDFKTIQIDNLDNLAFTSQACLRRIIEKHSKKYRFVLWCKSLTKISEPLKSRCLCIHIPYNSNKKLLKWAENICIEHKKIIEKDVLIEIIKKSNKNLKSILLGIDLYYYKQKINTSYDDNINNICEIVLSKKLDIRKLRDIVYNMENIVPYLKILKDITCLLLKKINNDNVKNIILNTTTNYEFDLTMARRAIIHIEAYFIFIHKLYNENNI